MGYLPIKFLLAGRRLVYIDGLSSKQINPLTLHYISTNTEYNEIIENFKLHNFKQSRGKVKWKDGLWLCFDQYIRENY